MNDVTPQVLSLASAEMATHMPKTNRLGWVVNSKDRHTRAHGRNGVQIGMIMAMKENAAQTKVSSQSNTWRVNRRGS